MSISRRSRTRKCSGASKCKRCPHDDAWFLLRMKKQMPENEEGWRERLSPEEYQVLREKGTEAPFSGKYVHEKAGGTYVCVACGNPLFSSDAKFDSGTGWPSYDEALPGAIETHHDASLGMPARRSLASPSEAS